MSIILHSTNCPKCKVLEAKLNLKNIPFQKNTDIDKMEKIGIMSVPMLEVDGEMFDFKRAADWINQQEAQE